ncbi:aspartyl protease family protein [Sphingomonas sp. TDK1]|uniref:aspartyl protease family protein n=1 Tax=Sphingomonas sp. TDK1 TaxID=453247 RepID=UPI001E433789|nr:aspartyl protease family protein [Sphingomonas sp. TDK1]
MRIVMLASLVALAPTASLQAQVPARQGASPDNRSISSIEHTVTILPAQQSAPTPFQSFKGIILIKVKINGRDGWAMLDNGFGHTVIDLDFAKVAGLKIGPIVGTIDLGPASAPERLIEGMKIDVPGQLILSGMGLSVDLKSFSNTVGHPIDAVIGGDYLDKLSFLVASSNNTLIFAKTGDIIPKGKAAIIPLQKGAQLAAEVNGKSVNLAIDLGFNGVVQLKKEVWERVISSKVSTVDGMTSSADGVLRPSRSVKDATLKVGGISADGVGVAVGDRIATSADGLLGTGFLTKFDFILDVGANRLVAIPFG